MITLDDAFGLANSARAQLYRAFAYLLAAAAACVCAGVIIFPVHSTLTATLGVLALLIVAIGALRAAERRMQRAVEIYRQLDRELDNGKE